MNYLVKKPWQKVITVMPLEHYQLQVEMDDNRALLLDLQPLIERREAYWRLRQERYF